MKKVFGQTVRDLKRGVNKKVLKVAGLEQKILDSTSNEPWGPHGTHLAEIAEATYNNHAYQLIMSILWRRINDTGKNWRHVFKALTVLEYLAAHGSECIIDDIREHAYQISTLTEFQYVDSGGRDQGVHIRRKSQSLVALVNDAERLREVRQKAQANKDKYGAPSTGGVFRQGFYTETGIYSDHLDDDHYGSKADERNVHRTDDIYGSSRYSDKRYNKDAYQDDNDDNHFRPRSRSIDGFTDRSFGHDDRHSSRRGGDKADDLSQDERGFERNLNVHNVAAPPSYEEATKSSRETIEEERDGDTITASQQNSASPTTLTTSSPSFQDAENAVPTESPTSRKNAIDSSGEFDPRGSAVLPTGSNPESDILGISASHSADPWTLVPENSTTPQSVTQTNSVFRIDFLDTPSASSPASSQPNEDPFGDAPFKAIPQENIQAQTQLLPHITSDQPSESTNGSETLPSETQNVEALQSFDFGDALGGLTYYAPTAEQWSDDILDAILPRNRSSSSMLSSHAAQGSVTHTHTDPMNPFQPSTHLHAAEMNPFHPLGSSAQVSLQEYSPSNTQEQTTIMQLSAASQGPPTNMQASQMNFFQQSAPWALQGSQMNMQNAHMNNFQPSVLSNWPAPQGSHSNFLQASQRSQAHMQMVQPHNYLVPPGRQPSATSQAPQTNIQTTQTNFLQSSSGLSGQANNVHAAQSGVAVNTPTAHVRLGPQSVLSEPLPSAGPTAKPQSKFEPKSTVWADTLSRGLVNLDISGHKTNPLADIGVDFDAINRRDKRLEPRSSAPPAASTIVMGKAMGSGSGIGRAAAGGFAPPRNPMMGMGMGMGMGGMAMGNGGGGGMAMGMGGYGGNMNWPPMGGMNMGMGQGAPPTQPPGPGMPGGGYPTTGMGGYGFQQPYGGGGYR